MDYRRNQPAIVALANVPISKAHYRAKPGGPIFWGHTKRPEAGIRHIAFIVAPRPDAVTRGLRRLAFVRRFGEKNTSHRQLTCFNLGLSVY
jgi:hypothetical protein